MKHWNTFAPALCLAAMTALTVSGAAAEELQVDDYQDELQRCVTALRSDLDLRDGDRVLHVVDTADRNGPWYRFGMETTVTDDEGIVVLDRLEVECRAHRANGQTLIKLDREPAAVRTARR